MHTYSGEGSRMLVDCTCNKGYTGADGGPCVACVEGKYKSSNGSNVCTDCKMHAMTLPGSSTIAQCVCISGYTDSDAMAHLCIPASTIETTLQFSGLSVSDFENINSRRASVAEFHAALSSMLMVDMQHLELGTPTLGTVPDSVRIDIELRCVKSGANQSAALNCAEIWRRLDDLVCSGELAANLTFLFGKPVQTDPPLNGCNSSGANSSKSTDSNLTAAVAVSLLLTNFAQHKTCIYLDQTEELS